MGIDHEASPDDQSRQRSRQRSRQSTSVIRLERTATVTWLGDQLHESCLVRPPKYLPVCLSFFLLLVVGGVSVALFYIRQALFDELTSIETLYFIQLSMVIAAYVTYLQDLYGDKTLDALDGPGENCTFSTVSELESSLTADSVDKKGLNETISCLYDWMEHTWKHYTHAQHALGGVTADQIHAHVVEGL